MLPFAPFVYMGEAAFLQTMIYQVAREQNQLGGFSVVELRNGLDSGKFLHSDLAWKAGMSDWKSLAEILEATSNQAPNIAETPAVPPALIKQFPVNGLRSGRAVTALVSGIVAAVSLGGGLLTSVLIFRQEGASPVAVGIVMLIALLISGTATLTAIICGHVSISEIRRSQGGKRGRGLAVTGLSLGYLMILVMVGLFFAMMLGS